MSRTKQKVKFVVLGEPASKANSRKVAVIKGRSKPLFIKSDKARAYADAFQAQCPQVCPAINNEVRVTITIYYASRRPDLDESVILDCMQSVVHRDKKTKKAIILRHNIYTNDRLVREKHIYWDIDPANPRAEIEVEVID